jgi:hypothetical protein
MIKSMRHRLFRRAPPPAISALVTLALATLVLIACTPGKNEFAPACPVPGVIRPLAELSRYSGASRDFRALVIRARIINVGGKCERGDDANSVVVTAQAVIDLTRGPAMQGQSFELPLFVAVTDGGAVLDKKLFSLTVEFAPNVDTARATSPEVRMVLPVTPTKSAAAYGVLAGFQLTPEEVAAMRQSKPR